MRIRTLLKEQGTPGWDSLDYLVYQSWAEDAPTITITNWNQSTCYANTSASSSNLLHKDQDIPLKLETVSIQLWAYWYTSSVVLTDNLGVEHPFSFYSSTSDSKAYTVRAGDYGAEYFNKVQLSASGSNGKAISVRANQLGRKEPEPDWGSDYDAEIEYLESTGTQYIDLGFRATNNIQFETQLYRSSNSMRWDCGAEDSWSDKIVRYIIIENSAATYRFGYSDVTESNNAPGSSNFVGDIRVIVNKQTATTYNLTSGYSATRSCIQYNVSTPFVTTGNFLLFGMYYQGPSFSTASSGIRLKGFKVTDTNVELDLIPVRKGQVGYLYDKVSGKLFGNSGTGSFILGPDV